jgi:hypothetical protein
LSSELGQMKFFDVYWTLDMLTPKEREDYENE